MAAGGRTDSSETEAAAAAYFTAIAARDLDAALACWKPGSLDHLGPAGPQRAPEGIRAYFEELFAAFPDFRYEVREIVASGDRAAVLWRATGTFSGGPFQGILANGVRAEIEGLDLARVEDGLLVENLSYWDDSAVARQLGLLPAQGSVQERAMKAAFNARTRMLKRLRRGNNG